LWQGRRPRDGVFRTPGMCSRARLTVHEANSWYCMLATRRRPHGLPRIPPRIPTSDPDEYRQGRERWRRQLRTRVGGCTPRCSPGPYLLRHGCAVVWRPDPTCGGAIGGICGPFRAWKLVAGKAKWVVITASSVRYSRGSTLILFSCCVHVGVEVAEME